MDSASVDPLNPALQRQAVAALQRALGAELIETHLSYVLLASGQAWKIKKAVNLGFVDFSTAGLREQGCREELRLNRRTAPTLYLGVLPLTGTPIQPQIAGTGPTIDWLLHMRGFDPAGLWDRLAREGRLSNAHIDAGIDALCELHRDAAVAAPEDPASQPAQARAAVLDNLAALPALCPNETDRASIAALTAWEAERFAALQPAFVQRALSGQVRECHGDLHLGNVTQFEGRTTLFDCLEFSAALRWGDVMNDLAFITMDLHAHGLPQLAHRWVNGHLERSADDDGLRVLRYHQVHRALVRAKVAALRQAQRLAQGNGQAEAHCAWRRYLDVALDCTRQRPPVLMLTHGFSGSGKTTLTQDLLERCGAVRLRADVERKRLFGMAPLARSDAAMKLRLYSDEANRATQARLHERATVVLQSGYSVILDATFLQRAQRDQVRALAERLGVAWLILDFQASPPLLRQRVQDRSTRGDDASEADLAVLEGQLATAQALDAEECAASQVIDVQAAAVRPAGELWAPLLQRLTGAAD